MSFLIISGIVALLLGCFGKNAGMLATGVLLILIGLDFMACLKLFLAVGVIMLPVTLVYNFITK